MNYLEFLTRIQIERSPKLYLEIGVRHGHSLSTARGRSYGIDPAFRIEQEIDTAVRLFRTTSDEFFARDDLEALFGTRIELGFIDGMHQFEFALRDFMNVEHWSDRNGLIVVDDVLPRNNEEAERTQRTPKWTGDVWKLYYCLKEYRPDLDLQLVSTTPTGLLLVSQLNPVNRSLHDNYDQIVERFTQLDFDVPPREILSRTIAVSPLGV